MKTALVTCGTRSRGLMYITWESQKRGTEMLFEEIMVNIFLKLMKTINAQIQEAQWKPEGKETRVPQCSSHTVYNSQDREAT